MTIDLLVVGGGPAGHGAAEAYRDAGGGGRVVVLAAEGRRAYRRPPLSKELLRGEAEAEELALEAAARPEGLRVEWRAGTATALDPRRGAVTLTAGERLAYRTCVLATGAEPVRPAVPGADLPGVHVLRDVGQALALRDAARAARRAVVVGSGFIGCEAAASLRAHGLQVTMLSADRAPQQARLGEEVAARLAGWLADAGVALRGGCELTAVREGDGGLEVVAATGAPLPADLVLLATGVRPRTGLAREAGLELADGGEVLAGTDMGTSAPGVLACGDCCRARHAVAGRHLHVEHWGDALAQGAVAGRRASGAPAAWEAVPGFWSTIGDRTLKYAAWGDGYDEVRVDAGADGTFTAWYRRGGACVGVLAHGRDDDYDAGREAIASGAPCPG
ncbi:oxidoreductase [Baekduia soli]|uniref:Oxidoreductase n=1 Tax=Baekduia soli TaxID=496014 RepID=A0A5B8UAR3_9ACTN|nr:FAD-dependent oxidoreductase [Baekduia soli]QEC49762.1 oxidoreductase [Baekduia soli]